MGEHTFKHGDRGVTELGTPVVWVEAFDSGYDYSGWRSMGTYDRVTVEVRPLAVIDPEDEADVQRLGDALEATADRMGALDIAAALREFANPKPPKPDEPTGWGAVVVDDEGAKCARTSLSPEHPWRKEGWTAYLTWRDIPVSSPDQIKFAGVEQ